MSGKIDPIKLLESVIGKNPEAFLYQPVYQVTESEVREFARLLAAPVVERQDPVYQVRSHGSCCWEDISGESLYVCAAQPEEYEIRKLYTSPPAPVAADIVHDRAYRNGMMAGFSFGIRGDEDGYAKAVERYDAEIHAAKSEQPAPVAADERAEFENHYRDRIMGNRTGVRFLRSASGSYLDSEVREMWSGWQARACLDKVKELNQ